jgi:hypothetical protein
MHAARALSRSVYCLINGAIALLIVHQRAR